MSSILEKTSLLTDAYQISMMYAYWITNDENNSSTFDVYFRKSPFKGEYAIFAGIDRVLQTLNGPVFNSDDIDILKKQFDFPAEFYDYIATLTFDSVTVTSVKQGEIVFPKEPVMTISGPVLICQSLETRLLNNVSFPTLVATCARRIVNVAKNVPCSEFGLRRAQGPDGAMCASQYSIVGGFDTTSNVIAGHVYDIPIVGTMAHSYIMSCSDTLDTIVSKQCKFDTASFIECIKQKQQQLSNAGFTSGNQTELAAFVKFAIAFPGSFVALIDTYNTLQSGVINYMIVATTLNEFGYNAVGLRIDSGDLAYLANECYKKFVIVDDLLGINVLKQCKIMVSNELSESVVNELHTQTQHIKAFGIGTKLATCYDNPALGMVYKLVKINDTPVVKISEESAKTTIPYGKKLFRLFDQDKQALADVMFNKDTFDNDIFTKNSELIFRHPTDGTKRFKISTTKVTAEPLHITLMENGNVVVNSADVTVQHGKQYCIDRLKSIRPDHLRITNPTPYKVSVSDDLYNAIAHLIFMETEKYTELS